MVAPAHPLLSTTAAVLNGNEGQNPIPQRNLAWKSDEAPVGLDEALDLIRYTVRRGNQIQT